MNVSKVATMKFRLLLRVTAIFTFFVVLVSPNWAARQVTPTPNPRVLDGWANPLAPTTVPWQFVKEASSGELQNQGAHVSSVVYNADPNGYGIMYSATADNPDVDAAVRNLAENLGNDPIKIYEWVRNNVRTEFYFGASRGAYLTFLERAGNDIDQCALLGALFKAAGYVPTYRLDWLWIPRTAVGSNRVGVYEWLGVSDDASALAVLSNYHPEFTPAPENNLILVHMWVSINIVGRGETKFVPSLKPHTVGRKPGLDTLSGYSWGNAVSAGGSVNSSSYSPSVNRTLLRDYMTARSLQASEAIRASGTLHDLSGAELSRLPIVVPEIVSVTAPNKVKYPEGLLYNDVSLTQPLTGIPQNYCSYFVVQVGSKIARFDATELLGRPISVEFDGSGKASIKLDGVTRESETQGGSGSVSVQLSYEPPPAYFGGISPQYVGTSSVERSGSVAVVYSFGRTVDRLNKTLRDVSAKEAVSASNVTVGDRLQVIGQQYVSQVHELASVGSAHLEHDFRRQFLAGLISINNGRPTVDMRINYVELKRRSGAAPATAEVIGAVSLLLGAMEGTAIEQLSGERSFGTAPLFDHAMTLGFGAHYITSVWQLNNSTPVIANRINYYLGSGAIEDIHQHLNGGGHVVMLTNSNVTYNSESFGGYFKVDPNFGGVASVIKGAKGGVSTGWLGILSFIKKLAIGAVNSLKAAFTQKPTVSTDPVDLATGAFFKDDTDLVLGNGGDVTGLRLDRHYSSARSLVDPTGLGRGWTHGYHMKLDLRSPNDFDSLRATVDEVLPILLAMRLTQDSMNNQPQAARTWLLSSVGLTWAVDQQLNSRATIAMGSRSMEFVKRPDGTFIPGSAVAATLVKNLDNSHELAIRHSNRIRFRASDGKFEWIKDPFENMLNATYDGSSRLALVADAYGRFFNFYYDGLGRLTSVADSTGRSVSYGREGSTFTFTDAEGKTERYEMDGAYRMTKISDTRARTIVENDYDAWGRVYRQRIFGDVARTLKLWITPGVGTEVDPTGAAVWTYFDARGRKIFVVNQDNKMSQWHYDGVDRLTEFVTPLGNISTYAYNQNHVLISETNPKGNTRAIIPDAQHRPWRVYNFEGQFTEFGYNAQHKVISITAPGNITSTFEYYTAGSGRGLLWKSYPAHYEPGKFDEFTYDAYGNLDKIKHPPDVYTADQDFDDYDYNVRGDLMQFIDRKDVKTTFTYNAKRQQLKMIQWDGATPITTETVYDASGDVDYVLNAANRKVDLEHDALGNLTEIRQGPIANQIVMLRKVYNSRNLLHQSIVRYDGVDRTTEFLYHATQTLQSVTDPLAHTTSFTYDDDLRRTHVKTPLGAAAIPPYSATTAWDKLGLKDGESDAEGNTADYTYDKDGRFANLANRLNKPYGWAYDDANRKITTSTPTGKVTVSTLSLRGLPASVKKPSDAPGNPSINFTSYDAEGRLLSRTDGVGATTYAYWPNGLLKSVTEGNKTTTRNYDALNRLSSYSDGEGNTLSYGYYASGGLRTISYPNDNPAAYPNGKTVTYTYDDFGRLAQVMDWDTRLTTYEYWENGLLKRINRANGTYRLQLYDAAGQLTGIREYTLAGTLFLFQNLQYDPDGLIRRSFIHPMPAAITLPFDTMEYDDDNRLGLFNGATVSHDADGNMTSGPLPSGAFGTYGYDARNRLVSAGGSSYHYNPDGHRVGITGGGAATFVIDPNAALSRTLIRTKGGVTTYYVYGHGLLYEATGGATKHYHGDQVGSTLALTDGNGTVTDRWTYSPFGTEFRVLGTTDTPFRFNGEYGVHTEANGLVQMRARFYNPRLMRFCNADPIRFGGGMNWYAFAGNDPISRLDPFGLRDSRADAIDNTETVRLAPFIVNGVRSIHERVGHAVQQVEAMKQKVTSARDYAFSEAVYYVRYSGYTYAYAIEKMAIAGLSSVNVAHSGLVVVNLTLWLTEVAGFGEIARDGAGFLLLDLKQPIPAGLALVYGEAAKHARETMFYHMGKSTEQQRVIVFYLNGGWSSQFKPIR